MIIWTAIQENPYLYTQQTENWKKWLDEVDLIITKDEKSVFKSLKTEEDKKRFRESFWRTRDPSPKTPENEFQVEYYFRRRHAMKNLEGANSDRGRIYILLGEPMEKNNYSGLDKVVDSELWSYSGEGRPGLPPFMQFIFFKQSNIGTYKLYHPGLHSPLDLLDPGASSTMTTKSEAYIELRMNYVKLADASLSIIPFEGDPSFSFGQTLTSSGSILKQIYTLPEKEVKKSYLKNYSSIEGIVDVDYSTKEIDGKGALSISVNKGFKFLNYSVMPNVIHTNRIENNVSSAKININLRLEDLEGKTIYQQEREIDVKSDDSKKETMFEEGRSAFKDFAPVVEGEFNVIITFTNKTSGEFFTFEERVNITDESVPVMVGYKVEESTYESFLPFCTENYKVLIDPRSIYNKSGSLEGIIRTKIKPEIRLIEVDDENTSIEIKNVEKRGGLFIFSLPLKDVKSANYYLSIKTESREVFRKIVSVMPFHAKKPIDFERSDSLTSEFDYVFAMAQQYYNKGDVDTSLEYLNRIPEELWTTRTLLAAARAYHKKQDYEKVVQLLDKKGVEKNYFVLLLLANSVLKTNRLQKAAEYFEMLRQYEDTTKINNVLGAIYHSLGEREKAKVYWDRANNLKKKSDKKKQNSNKGEQSEKDY